VVTGDFERARRTTPARLDVGRAGARPRTAAWLQFQRDHAAAQDAVWSEWSPAFLDRLRELGFLIVQSAAPNRLAYIRQPPLGRQIPAAVLEQIRAQSPAHVAIQLVWSDGLSATAAEAHFERLYPSLRRHCERLGTLGVPVAVRNGRVAAADAIGAAAGAQLVVHLIGERPGLGTADSLGCYLTFRPGPTTTDADRKCVSNIRPQGLSPDEAGATIAGVCQRIFEKGTSGTDLEL
jgi:ethanolamine ammonia-lyase small subunit